MWIPCASINPAAPAHRQDGDAFHHSANDSGLLESPTAGRYFGGLPCARLGASTNNTGASPARG